MKRNFFALAVVAIVPYAAAWSQQAPSQPDTLTLEHLQEVVVRGVRAQKNAPFAVAQIDKQELQQFSTTGRELPFLFSQTPGVLSWSENGLGTGTTYMRIRGAGDSRINVTLDGVPLNSPEDQCVFWANMNSYASLLGSVQIQRGIGSSTNGDGAFGGTISLSSKSPSLTPTAEVDFSTGSYNTYHVGGSLSTGLLWNHWILDGAYHETNTDGYIHGTSGRSGSYYGSLRFLRDNLVIAYKNIGNFEKTGQAWNGVTAGNNDLSIMDGIYGEKTGIKTYKDMYDRGLGKFNSLYEELMITPLEQKTDGNPYAYTTKRYTLQNFSPSQEEAGGGLTNYWDKTTDNFWQNHNLLTAAWDINAHWSTTGTLHYTYGYGYYNEFRPNNKLSKFGLSTITTEEGKVKRTDFVRKKGLSQDTYGLVWNANYKNQDWNIVSGLSLQNFSGNHFGYITYAANPAVRHMLISTTHPEINGGNTDAYDLYYKYYDSDASKIDGNAYLKAAYRLTPQWEVFADVQYRHVGYKTDGYNDKFIDNGDGTYSKHYLDINNKYDFLNPKVGFTWHTGSHRVYGSVAMSHREPERNNFTDNGNYPAPKAESLLDYELGYQLTAQTWRFGVNAYYMDYTDQFVQTGMLSDIGEPLTTNIKDSYRLGVELTTSWAPLPWMTVEGNAALSKNKIKDFDEYIEDWDDWEGNPDAATYHCDGNGDGLRQFHYDNSTLAFSPSVILNGFLNLHHKGWQAIWHTNFVSRQYLDNTENCDRSLPSFSQSDLSLSYTLDATHLSSLTSNLLPLKKIIVGLNLNNVFNRHYAASGWVYSAVAESYGHTPDNRYYQIGFIPMCGFTAMGSITLRF